MRGVLRGWSLAFLAMLGGVAAQAGGVPAKTIKELKLATVYIKVTFRDAVGAVPATGSGFVAHVEGTTGYIVTNDHVVSPRPGEVRDGPIKLVFGSGTADEKTVDGAIVASDPVRDLAVLKVTGVPGLPRPIPMDAANEAIETTPVYSLGFPFGKKLAFDRANPAITITRGTVSSLRSDSKGQVSLVQIDAEINPGNSGGPVVDDKGNLVGVAVSKMIDARTVGFAIPVKPVAEMMQGKVGRVNFDTLKLGKGEAQISVEAGLIDPLGKVKDLVVHYRRAADVRDLPRAAKDGATPLLKDARAVALKADGARAVGAFPLALAGADRLTIAYQASFTNGAGQKIVTPATIASIVVPKVIFADKLTRSDPVDKTRGQPAKKFTHKMLAGKHYVIEMRGDPREVDPWLILRDQAGKILAEDDDSGGLLNALIVFSPRQDGDYEITATVFKGGPLGPFTLRIREDTGVELGPKEIQRAGRLSDKDLPDPWLHAPSQSFNLILKKGKPCKIDVKSTDFDPYVRLENMAGVNVKIEDVGGEGHSTLVFNPLADGIYRAVITSYDFKSGAYDFKAAEDAVPQRHEVPPAGLRLAGALTPTDPLDVQAGKASKFRCKVYQVKLKAGQKYQIDLTSTDFDAYLRIEDTRAKELAVDDDSGGMLNARIIFAPPADGVYRVIATHFDARLGSFNLQVRPLGP